MLVDKYQEAIDKLNGGKCKYAQDLFETLEVLQEAVDRVHTLENALNVAVELLVANSNKCPYTIVRACKHDFKCDEMNATERNRQQVICMKEHLMSKGVKRCHY